jgi:GDPmannose 4,6-dehydratase
LLELAFSIAEVEDWERYVTVDQRFFRPADVDELVADSSKARRALGWEPDVSFEELVRMMVEHDLNLESKRAGGLI